MVKGNLRAINIPNNSVDQVMRHQIQQDIVVLYVDILPVICSVSECITLLVSQAVSPFIFFSLLVAASIMLW